MYAKDIGYNVRYISADSLQINMVVFIGRITLYQPYYKYVAFSHYFRIGVCYMKFNISTAST